MVDSFWMLCGGAVKARLPGKALQVFSGAVGSQLRSQVSRRRPQLASNFIRDEGEDRATRCSQHQGTPRHQAGHAPKAHEYTGVPPAVSSPKVKAR